MLFTPGVDIAYFPVVMTVRGVAVLIVAFVVAVVSSWVRRRFTFATRPTVLACLVSAFSVGSYLVYIATFIVGLAPWFVVGISITLFVLAFLGVLASVRPTNEPERALRLWPILAADVVALLVVPWIVAALLSA